MAADLKLLQQRAPGHDVINRIVSDSRDRLQSEFAQIGAIVGNVVYGHIWHPYASSCVGGT